MLASIGLLFNATASFADRYYLDDANTRDATPGAAPPLSEHGFPRVFNHEFIGGTSTEAASRYMFVDAHGTSFNKMQTVQQSYSPDTMLLRHISGRAYQQYNSSYCNISGGPAFESTTATSQGGPKSNGCGIYAGHWLYEAGTTLRQNVNQSATTLPVQDASRFDVGHYVVIYNAPAGSFNNAEHAKITGKNVAGKTITVQRGYKSAKSNHNAGSIVAQHVLGQGTEKRLWAFNMSTVAPKDASGKLFWQFYADWIGTHYNRHNDGAQTGANIAGVVLDADFWFDLTNLKTDWNNDLVYDDGVSGNGTNWLGEGLNAFYQRLRNRIPHRYVVVGVHDARGFQSAQGGQMENWLDYGNGDYNPKPQYKKLDELFQTYLFNMAERHEGPALVHNLTKTPTRLYPGKSSPKPTSNAPFRLALALTLMEDGYFGTHTAMTPDAWWDEYAVNLIKGSGDYGKAVPKSDFAGVRLHRGWMGKPLGKFKRVYNDTDFAPGASVLGNGTFDSNIQKWTGNNVNLSRETGNAQDGSGALAVSRMNQYKPSITGASVRSESINTGGAVFTLAFSARSDKHREIRVDLGGDVDKIPVGPKWRRYVVEMKTGGGTSTLRFQLGREDSRVWLDSIYLFKGKSAAVFKREFENGMALANASTSSKTIHVGSGWRRIKGTQDPTINNGAAVTSVTIPPRDGLLLIRDGAASSPATGGGGGGGGSGSASIGDLVWRDTDGDGRQDGNESGYGGVTVRLQSCSGNTLQTTVTANDGSYSFSNLAAGNYQLNFVAPSGATPSPYRATSGWGDDSDAYAGSGNTACISMSSGQSRMGVDAGFIPPAGGGGGGGGGSGTASIGDLVWRDADGDGRQDGNESGYGGVTVRLQSCSGNTLASTVTANDGSYSFSNLAAGNYQLNFVAPSGATPSPYRATGGWGDDSDAYAGSGNTACISMSSGQSRMGVDAGFVPPAGGGGGGGSGNSSIGDFVWRDTDGDGIQDGNESGWSGVNVSLMSCSGNVLANTTTNGNGAYTFSNLAAGSYQVRFESPSNSSASPFRAGSNWGADSDANEVNGTSLCVQLGSNENKRGVDAGFVPQQSSNSNSSGGSIGDLVWRDSNGDGIKGGSEPGVGGVQVQLRWCGGGLADSTVTNNNGYYTFNNISNGSYKIQVQAPSGASFSPPRAGSDYTRDSNAETDGVTTCMQIDQDTSKPHTDIGLVY